MVCKHFFFHMETGPSLGFLGVCFNLRLRLLVARLVFEVDKVLVKLVGIFIFPCKGTSEKIGTAVLKGLGYDSSVPLIPPPDSVILTSGDHFDNANRDLCKIGPLLAKVDNIRNILPQSEL